MKHEDYGDILATHALSALDADEAQALEAHLGGCAECRIEMDQWEQTAALLALESRPAEPSSQVRVRLLESIQMTPATGKLEGETRNGASRRVPNVVHISAASQPKWTPAQSWVAVAAVVTFVALTISLILLWQQNRAKHRELVQLGNQIQDTERELDRERKTISILSTPGARLAQLSGTKVAPSAQALLAYDEKGHAILLAKGLPAAPPGKIYQLWFIAGGQPLPGKVFSPGPSGEGTLDDLIPPAALKTAVFAITLEPSGGVKSPTGAIYLSSAS
jgi:anti-sigma-K factor RskA